MPLHEHRIRTPVGRVGMTLVQAVVLAAAVCVAIVILVGLLSFKQKLTLRMICATQLSMADKGLRVCRQEQPNGPTSLTSNQRTIRYTIPVGGGHGTPESPDRYRPDDLSSNGVQEYSLTRLLWASVRTGDTHVKFFICPESDDLPDPTENIDAYYDFAGYQHVSYGFQVPFGWGAGAAPDSRMPLMADKGPYIDASVQTPSPLLTAALPPDAWAPYNSRNHRGQGQNVLFMDGHATFERTPLAGIDHDNIYTVALDAERPESRIGGESPWLRSAYPFTVFDRAGKPVASTDSVIFP